MTYFHFINCMALTYAPFLILYNASKLSDYSAFSSCVFAGLFFGATEIVKIVAMATFFPPEESTELNLLVEIGRVLVTTIELLGIYITLKRTPFLGKYPPSLRVLAVGLGWSFTEALLSYLIPLWMGARGEEFSWNYIEMSLLSNINLLMHLGITGAVWLFSRRNLPKSALPFVSICCFAYVLYPSVARYLELIGTERFHILGGRAVVAATIAPIVRYQLNNYEKPKN